MPGQLKDTHYMRGILYAVATCLLWGVLPIVSKVALEEFSAGTIVWFRFTFAFVLLFVFLSLQNSRPLAIIRRPPLLGLLGGVSLAANYYYFLEGVHFSGPSNTAVLVQIAPVLVVIVGIFLFNEKLRRSQVFGILVAAGGFFLFYLDQRNHAADPDLYSTANRYIIFAAVIWTVYIACVKQLSVRYGAQLLNLLVYGIAATALVLGVKWMEFVGVDPKGWGLLLCLGLNTLLAYGALAESIKYIPLTHISVIIILNPLITLLVMRLLKEFGPGWVKPDIVGPAGYFGALLAVFGVVLVVMKK